MANTWHHDRKRHLIHGRLWPFHYSGAGPKWFRRMHEKPKRRAANMIAARYRGRGWWSFLGFGDHPPDCEGCEIELLEQITQLDDLDPEGWPRGNKPTHYYW